MSEPSATVRLIADAADQSVYSIGLAEEIEPGDDTFALAFSVAEPDQDGLGYCVIAEPGQRAAYDAVTSCELDGTRLHLCFTTTAATDLGLPSELVLELAVTEEDIRTLERGLRRVGVAFNRHFPHSA